MNALTEFGKQIANLFESMTPSARIMAGLMVGVIVISLGWVFTSQQTTSAEYLFGGRNFSDPQLDLIEATLSDAGLREFERVGHRIRIPSATKDVYLKALSAGNALPRQPGGYMDEALCGRSPFESNSIFENGVEFAKEREVSSLIERMPGIEFASVDYDEKRTGFARNTLQSCSVTVQAIGSAVIPPETLKVIAQMVQPHFAGLTYSNIAVTDLGSGQVYRAPSDPSLAEENPYLKAQTDFERVYTQKIAGVFGTTYGNIQLAVNVELDPTLAEESEKLKFDPTAVTVQSSESRKDQENIKPSPSGPPGAASNGVSNQPQSIASNATGQSSNSKQSENNEQRVAGHEAIITTTAGLVPRKVNVTIGVPESHYRKVWQYRKMLANPDATEPPGNPTEADLTPIRTETEASIKAAVAGIPVGIREGDDREPFVQVYSYTDLPIPDLPEPTMAETATSWLAQSWSTLALLGVVLLSLGMVFSWVRSQQPGETDARFADGFGLEVPDLTDELVLGEDGEAIGPDGKPVEGRRKPALDLTGGEMKEDLSTLIRENPDAAVNLLKAWIGEAA